jgi:hypothetical protein
VGETCSTHSRDEYEILVGHPNGRRPLKRGMYVTIILKCPKIIRFENMDWIELAQDRVH